MIISLLYRWQLYKAKCLYGNILQKQLQEKHNVKCLIKDLSTGSSKAPFHIANVFFSSGNRGLGAVRLSFKLLLLSVLLVFKKSLIGPPDSITSLFSFLSTEGILCSLRCGHIEGHLFLFTVCVLLISRCCSTGAQ